MKELVTILPGAAWHGLKVGLAAAVLAVLAVLGLNAAGLSIGDPLVAIGTGIVLIAILLPLSVWEARRSGFMKTS